MTTKLLTFKEVNKVYEKGGMSVSALRNLSFTLSLGTHTLVSGPSGAGKTSLIHLAGLIQKPSAGDISFKGISTLDLNENQRAKMIRNEVGFIFRRANLLPHLTILENVLLPMVSSEGGKAKELLEQVELDDWNRFPPDLSMEEEQKVALARSLVNNPSLLLGDEPTADLDLKATENFLEILEKMKNITILLTSSEDSLQKFFQETYRLKYGIIEPY
ncbi:MAG: ATP-binding cassette domain-containing protein [Methanobacterium sp.]|nr:ATP-binding cassette domain-containing protein [Methanobacterium sp.]